jgi:TorA maturation chaperone TorD
MADWWSPPSRDSGREPIDGQVARGLAAALGVDRGLIDGVLQAESHDPGSRAEEYERLFVGPGRTPCPPYGAYWWPGRPWQESGSVSGQSTSAVADLYAEMELRLRAEWREPPDYIAFEWEALAWALELGLPSARVLLDEHLRAWLPPFCAAVQEHAAHPFYGALAALTPVWAEALARSGRELGDDLSAAEGRAV